MRGRWRGSTGWCQAAPIASAATASVRGGNRWQFHPLLASPFQFAAIFLARHFQVRPAQAERPLVLVFLSGFDQRLPHSRCASGKSQGGGEKVSGGSVADLSCTYKACGGRPRRTSSFSAIVIWKPGATPLAMTRPTAHPAARRDSPANACWAGAIGSLYHSRGPLEFCQGERLRVSRSFPAATTDRYKSTMAPVRADTPDRGRPSR